MLIGYFGAAMLEFDLQVVLLRISRGLAMQRSFTNQNGSNLGSAFPRKSIHPFKSLIFISDACKRVESVRR